MESPIKIECCDQTFENSEETFKVDIKEENLSEKSTATNGCDVTVKQEGGIFCTVCQDSFSVRSDLQNHLEVCHPEFFEEHFLMGIASRTKENIKLEPSETKFESWLTFNDLPSGIVQKKDNLQPEEKPKNTTRKKKAPVYQNFTCDVCLRKFATSTNMNRHIRIHTGEKPFKCTICDRNFGYENALLAHSRTHTGERPYQCDICNKTFPYQRSLVVHKRTHTQEKAYQCEICNKSFAHDCNLKRHLRNHTGQRSYSCETCDKSFLQSNHLLRHMKIHTREKNLACNLCSEKFALPIELRRHLKAHYQNRSTD